MSRSFTRNAALCALLSLAAPAVSFSDPVQASAPAKEKTLTLRPETERRPDATGVALDVKVGKKTYKAKEAITLQAKVDENAYIYVFQPDAKTGDLTLIYPVQAADNTVVKAKKWVRLPRNQEFFGDTAGEEALMIVASREKVDLSTIGDASQGAKQFKRADADQAFAAKSIQLRDAPKTSRDVKVVKLKIIE